MNTDVAPARRKLTIGPARPGNLDCIMALEQQCFPSPWPRDLFRRELRPGRDRVYIIAEVEGETAGYAGMWCFSGEAHIGTIAVAEKFRRTGVGEILLLTLLGAAILRGGGYATLEYRASNDPAARLYEKLGFTYVRLRRGYYTDTNEDAVEVAIDDLATPPRQEALAELARRWLAEHDYDIEVELEQPDTWH